MSKQQKKAKSNKPSRGRKAPKFDGQKQTEGDSDEEENLVLYIGHLPKDFEEIDLRRFLSQFGKVYNCRVARKIETGRPKGYAFVRFGDEETTKIVSQTLHGYFLEKQRLVCQLRPSHPGMFYDTEKLIDKRKKKIQLEARQRNRNLGNSEKLKAITSRLVQRERKKREKLKALGIDYDFPGYEANQDDFENDSVPEESNDDKPKRRKESMDSTRSEESAKKKKKKKRKDSIDSVASSSKADGNKNEKKKKIKKRRTSAA